MSKKQINVGDFKHLCGRLACADDDDTSNIERSRDVMSHRTQLPGPALLTVAIQIFEISAA